jgi:hypothetical protein
MQAKDWIALGAVLATAIGWGVGYVLSSRESRRLERMKTAVKHLESQLQELYGPLAFLIWEGQRSWKDLFDTLEILRGEPQQSVFPLTKKDELELWLFWVDNDLLPRNERIRELLMSKTHLIEGASMPRSYLEFLEHHNSWNINHLRWQKQGIEYPWHSKVNYPQNFGKEVTATFGSLKERYYGFLEKLSTSNASH